MNKISPFVSVYQKGNYTLLFNHLTLARHYMHKKDYSQILENEELIKKGLVVEENFNEGEYFIKIKEEILKNQQEPKISLCYLLLTSDCNYDCEYCFIRANTKEKRYMAVETAKKAVQFFKKNMDKGITQKMIYFYGGEPLLNFPALKAAVEETKKTVPEAMLVLVTNGSLLTEEVADFLAQNKVKVSLSIDGHEEVNNKARKTCDRHGASFNLIIKGLNNLKHAGITPSILCTVGQHNANHLEKIVQFFINGTGSRNINFILQKRMKNWTRSKHIAKQVIRSYETAKLNGSSINNFRKRKILHFVTRIPRVKDCAGYGQQIVITPEGEVGPCHAFWPLGKFLDLTVDSDIKAAEHETWKEWNRRTTYNEPRCRYCEAISLCGGGCAFNHYTAKEGIWNIDETTCQFIKEVIQWLIWAYFEHAHSEKVKTEGKLLTLKLPSWTDDKRYTIFLKKIGNKTLNKNYSDIKKIIKNIYEDKEICLLTLDKSEVIGIAYDHSKHVFLKGHENDEIIAHAQRKLEKLNQTYLTGELKKIILKLDS